MAFHHITVIPSVRYLSAIGSSFVLPSFVLLPSETHTPTILSPLARYNFRASVEFSSPELLAAVLSSGHYATYNTAISPIRICHTYF